MERDSLLTDADVRNLITLDTVTRARELVEHSDASEAEVLAKAALISHSPTMLAMMWARAMQLLADAEKTA